MRQSQVIADIPVPPERFVAIVDSNCSVSTEFETGSIDSGARSGAAGIVLLRLNFALHRVASPPIHH